ncbi:hypothetical protein QFZ63_005426 [Streptomyces sp. B3I7]|nr:hypothetical protein [Streptomyces sp. B3I7]
MPEPDERQKQGRDMANTRPTGPRHDHPPSRRRQ